MKPSTLIAQAAAAAPSLGPTLPPPASPSLAPAVPPPAAQSHAPVPLAAPLNWCAGHALYPDRILEGFGAPHEQHTMQTWALHVLRACADRTDCNSTISFAVLDERTREMRWVGYAFWGPHTTQHDYNRSSHVQDSVAYNVLRLPGA